MNGARPLAIAAIVAAGLAPPCVAGAGRSFESPMTGYPAALSWELQPPALAIGDVNGDRHPDVVAPGVGFHLHVLLGNGDGSLAAPIGLMPGATPIGYPALADFDGDGHMDIGAANASGVRVFFGDGTGSVWEPVALGTGYHLQTIALDADADGWPDLVTIVAPSAPGGDSEVRTYLSRPGRSFEVASQAHPEFGGAQFWSLNSGDFDGDGRSDLAASCRTAAPAGWTGLSNGDGTFAFTSLPYVPLLDPGGSDVADVTGDGHLDVVVAQRVGLVIHPGTGAGAFGPPQWAVVPTEDNRGVACGDVTSDGLPDLVSSDAIRSRIMVRPGLPGGGFGPPQEAPLGGTLHPLELADMNGDGDLDVVGMSLPGQDGMQPFGVLIALGNGAGGFGHARTRAGLASSAWKSPVAGDFDQDGLVDLAAVSNSYPTSLVYILGGVPGRTFAPRQTLGLDAPFSSIRSGDLDEDGVLDLVVSATGAASGCRWLRGLGDGTFANPQVIAGVTGPVLALGEITGDDHLDLLSLGASLVTYPGLGTGEFGSPIVHAPVPASARSAFPVELNGDGSMDVLVQGADGQGDRWIVILHGQPSGALVAGPAWETTSDGFGAGDVNGDGRADIIDTATDGFGVATVRVRLQLPGGSFAAPIESPAPNDPGGRIFVGDISGDGIPDLVARVGSGWAVLRGVGDGSFVLEASFDGLRSSMDPDQSWCPLVDFDADGRLDLFAADRVGDNYGVGILYGRDPEAPLVAVSGPVPPARLVIGLSATVAWSASDNEGLAGAEIFASLSGSAGPFETIGNAEAASGSFSWLVAGPVSDSVCFRVVVRDLAGNTAWSLSEALMAILPATGIEDPVATAKPGLAIRVVGSHPVRSQLAMGIDLPAGGRARVTIHDLQGRQVARLLETRLPAGRHERTADLSASGIGTGLYFLRVETDEGIAATRMVVLE